MHPAPRHKMAHRKNRRDCTNVSAGGVLECSCGPQNGVIHSKPLDLQSIPWKQYQENSFRAESSQISVHCFSHKKVGIVHSKEKSSCVAFWQQRSFWFPGSSCFQARASWLLMLSSSMFTVVHLHCKYFGFTWECDLDITCGQEAEEWGIWIWILSIVRIFCSYSAGKRNHCTVQ